MLVFFFLFLFGFVFAFVVKYAFISEKNGITKCVKVVIWEAQLLCMFESLFCQNNWVISHMLIVWELQFIQQRCEITQLRFLWKWIFSLEMDVNTTVNEHHTTNKQTDRQQSSILVCSLQRKYVRMFKTLQWNHLLAAGDSIWHLGFEHFVIFQ